MKIAIPSDEKTMTSNISQSFGRTPYFLIYDTETKEGIFLDNSAESSQSGAGIKAATTIVNQRVDALLTPRCGENAAEVIKAAHIKLYKTTFETLQENIDAFQEGKLTLLQEISPGLHGHGG